MHNTLVESAEALRQGAQSAAMNVADAMAQGVLDARNLRQLDDRGLTLASTAVSANLTIAGLYAPGSHAPFPVEYIHTEDGKGRWQFVCEESGSQDWDSPEDAARHMGMIACAATSPTPLLRPLAPSGAQRERATPEPLPQAWRAGLHVLPERCGPPVNDDEVEDFFEATASEFSSPSLGRFAASGSDAYEKIKQIASGAIKSKPNATRVCKRIVDLVSTLNVEGFTVLHDPLVGFYLSFGQTNEHSDKPVYAKHVFAQVMRLVLTLSADPNGVWPVQFVGSKGPFAEGRPAVASSERVELTLGRGGYGMDAPTSGMACALCGTTAVACGCLDPRLVKHWRRSGGPGFFLQLDLCRPAEADPLWFARLMQLIAKFNSSNRVIGHGSRTGFQLPFVRCGAMAGIERWIEKPVLMMTTKSAADRHG